MLKRFAYPCPNIAELKEQSLIKLNKSRCNGTRDEESMQKTLAFTICSCSSWLTCKPYSKPLPFYKLRTPERNSKKFKILPSLRSKMSPEITSNDPRLQIFHVQRKVSSFNLSTERNILTFCTERQNCQTHVLDATACHQDDGLNMRNMSPL